MLSTLRPCWCNLGCVTSAAQPHGKEVAVAEADVPSEAKAGGSQA